MEFLPGTGEFDVIEVHMKPFLLCLTAKECTITLLIITIRLLHILSRHCEFLPYCKLQYGWLVSATMKGERLMTAVEFAKAIDYDYSTVMRWLRRGLVPGVEFMPVSESGKFGIWRIPESALQMEKPRLGRKKDSSAKKTSAKKSSKKGGTK
jgi:hypothetical protein